MRRRRDAARAADEAREVADCALRVAVLLQAGIAPQRAWSALAQVDDPHAVAIEARMRAGASAAEAIRAEGAAWLAVSAAWRIATDVGAPLADTLRSIGQSVRDAAEASDDVRVALTEPATTARLMLWLPVLGVLLGLALGLDTVRILGTTPAGIACLVLGTLFLVAARWWTGRLVRRAMAAPSGPGLREELTAVALTGGTSVERARTLVDDAQLGDHGDLDGTARVLELSRAAGVPAVDLLRASAAAERQRARTDARIRAARLSSGLLLPLGVCTLPAFFLLGVAPMVLSVLLSTEVTW